MHVFDYITLVSLCLVFMVHIRRGVIISIIHRFMYTFKFRTKTRKEGIHEQYCTRYSDHWLGVRDQH